LLESFLSEVAGGIEKHGALLFPVLCICGGITVIGAGTFVSHFDEVSGPAEKEKRPGANPSVFRQPKGKGNNDAGNAKLSKFS